MPQKYGFDNKYYLRMSSHLREILAYIYRLSLNLFDSFFVVVVVYYGGSPPQKHILHSHHTRQDFRCMEQQARISYHRLRIPEMKYLCLKGKRLLIIL